MKQRIRGICGILLTAAVLCAWGCGSKPQDGGATLPPAASATPEKETIDYLNELTEIEFTQAKNVILFIGDGMGMRSPGDNITGSLRLNICRIRVRR